MHCRCCSSKDIGIVGSYVRTCCSSKRIDRAVPHIGMSRFPDIGVDE